MFEYHAATCHLPQSQRVHAVMLTFRNNGRFDPLCFSSFGLESSQKERREF